MSNTANTQNAALTSTSYVDIVAAPTSGNKRLVANVNVANTSTTTPISVTLAYDDNGTVRLLAPAEAIPANGYRQFGTFVLTNVAGTAPQKLKAKLSATGTVDVVATFADA